MVGPACENVTAIDYVDADGELRHASETENHEMLWTARGSGPGFFGVVVRFHLRLHRKPAFIGMLAIQYPVERLEDLVRWMGEIGPSVPPQVELQFIVSRNPSFPPPIRRATRTSPVRIELLAPVMAESRSAAKAATSFLSTRPKGARVRTPLVPMPLSAMFSGVMQHYPAATNWETDNLWTHASADELLPHLLSVAAAMPPPPAHMLWLNWAPRNARADMAFTVEDLTYLAFYGGWKDPSDAAATTAWSRGTVAAMQPLSSGVQFADDPGRPARAVSESAQDRLEVLRADHDPDGRFHRWIGSP
jgi:FAD/FMN-containing dehydrogenase